VSAYEAQAWSDFGVAVAGAGAALAGLLFVALSINLDRILAGYRLTARAGSTLILLGTPLLIALLLLIPDQSDVALGWELVVLGVVAGGALVALNPPWLRAREQHLSWWVTLNAVPILLLSASTIIAGIGTMTESLGGLYWLPAGIIAALIAALENAWVLLVEILR
jgi:hypothetical protein